MLYEAIKIWLLVLCSIFSDPEGSELNVCWSNLFAYLNVKSHFFVMGIKLGSCFYEHNSYDVGLKILVSSS